MSRRLPKTYEEREKDRVFENRVIYCPKVHLGFWSEDVALEEENRQVTAYKAERCLPLLQRTRKMFRNVLKAIELDDRSTYLKYGMMCQIRASDIRISARNIQGKLSLAGVINENDIDVIQHFRHGCIISASPLEKSCVRNTFKILGDNEDQIGQHVFYGDNILLQISESGGLPLYIHCQSQSTDTLGGHLSLNLSETPDLFCRFKLLDWDPQKRLETTNPNTVKTNSRVVIQHSSSGRNLSVEPNEWMPTFYGPECAVSCHTYRDSHKMEKAENFWQIITSL